MTDLKQSVVRVVRTSTEDVDRRRTRRYPTDLAGRLTLASGVEHGVRLADLSEGGATLHDAPDLPAKTRGTLSLAEVPFALPFMVRDGRDGTLNLAFTLDAASAETFAPIPGRLALQRAA
jgi:hypothetical protein